ncbi:hypothetical protein ACOMHN_021670 [Nucella lapillus]
MAYRPFSQLSTTLTLTMKYLCLLTLLVVTCDLGWGQELKVLPYSWEAEDFPNPQHKPRDCGLGNTPGYVCDPNEILSRHQLKTLNWFLMGIADIKNTKECPCSHYHCEHYKGQRFYKVAIALVPSLKKQRKLVLSQLSRCLVQSWELGYIIIIIIQEYVKPPRGKRVDPQSRPAEFSSEGCCDRTPGRRSQDSPGFGTRVGRVHFPRAERHDRFPGGQKAARMVGARLGACWYSLACPDPPSGTEEPPSAWAAPPSRDVRLAETGQPCLPTASLDGSVGGPCRHRVGGESVGPPPDPS